MPFRNRTLAHGSTGIVESRYWVSGILVFLTLSTIILNFMVIITIISKTNLRRSQFNLFLINLCFVCVCEGLFNMVPSCLFLIKGTFSLLSCRINAFTTQMTTIGFTIAFCAMWIERCGSLWTNQLTRPVTQFIYFRQYVSIFVQWLMSMVFALPSLIGLFQVKFFESRYCCSISSTSRCFPNFLGAWSHGILFFTSIICIVNIGVKLALDKRSRKLKPNAMEMYFEESFYWSELKKTKFVSLLMVVYFILFFPYVLVDQMDQACLLYYHNLYETNRNRTKIDVAYRKSSSMDNIFTWNKFVFVWLIPLIVLWFRKDIRYKFTNLFCCWHRKTVANECHILPRGSWNIPVTVTTVTTPCSMKTKTQIQGNMLDIFAKIREHKQQMSEMHEWNAKHNKVIKYHHLEKCCSENDAVVFKEIETTFIQDSMEDELNYSEMNHEEYLANNLNKPPTSKKNTDAYEILINCDRSSNSNSHNCYEFTDESEDSDRDETSDRPEYIFVKTNIRRNKIFKRQRKNSGSKNFRCVKQVPFTRLRSPDIYLSCRGKRPSKVTFSVISKRARFF